MAIPNPDQARQITKTGGGVGSFLSTMIKDETKRPATLNKWTISFASPPILLGQQVGGQSTTDKTTLESRGVADLLDYFAKSVSLPSRQITTGQFQPPGASVRYATNQSFSQMQVEFIIPSSQQTRAIFETWVNRISRDSNQMVDFYQQYVSPVVRVYKWESQSNINVLTGCWEMFNVFPYNIGSIQLNNEQNGIMTLSMGFYYERYRFHAAEAFSDPGLRKQITVPDTSGGTTDDRSERNFTQHIGNFFNKSQKFFVKAGGMTYNALSGLKEYAGSFLS